MGKFFQKSGNSNDNDDNENATNNDRREEEAMQTVMETPQDKLEVVMEAVLEVNDVNVSISNDEIETESDSSCEDETCSIETTATVGVPPVVLQETNNNSTNNNKFDNPISSWLLSNDITTDDNRIAISLGVGTVVFSLLLVVVAYYIFFRRKQRRQQRAVWRKNNKLTLTKVEGLVEQVEARDVEVNGLKKKIAALEESTKADQTKLEEEGTAVQASLETKQTECDKLQSKVDDLRKRRQETDARLEQISGQVKAYADGQQDRDCQLLEQKLQASKLETALADREAHIIELQNLTTNQAIRIEELQHKSKSDATKAETIIGKLVNSERDDRFAILQQENDAIKTTVMGLLKQTQETYDADKALLKREMRKRDDRIRTLQEELWKSNALLKQQCLQQSQQQQLDPNSSQSTRNLITNKETKEGEHGDDTSTAGGKHPVVRKEKRSSTYEAAETILEGGSEDCEELKELQNLLSY